MDQVVARWKRKAVVGAGIAVLAGLALLAVLGFNGCQQDAIAGQGRELASAIERGDPSLAPDGGEDYVDGIRRYYGGVSRAEFLEARPYTKTAATTPSALRTSCSRRAAGPL